MATAKQIAWRKKFAEMAKAGALKKAAKKTAKKTTRKAAAVKPAPAKRKMWWYEVREADTDNRLGQFRALDDAKLFAQSHAKKHGVPVKIYSL